MYSNILLVSKIRIVNVNCLALQIVSKSCEEKRIFFTCLVIHMKEQPVEGMDVSLLVLKQITILIIRSVFHYPYRQRSCTTVH